MEDDALLEINKNHLKKIFYQNLSDRESNSITKKQFLKFLKTTKVHPDLISSIDLKKLFNLVLLNEHGEKIQEISYQKYEKLLKSLSKHCFPTENPLKLLITHIKPSCLINYQVNLTYKLQKEVFLNSTQRLKSSHHEIFSNKTTFKKSQSQKFSLSSTLSPANQTKVNLHIKLKEFRTPSLKILNQSNFNKKNEKIAELRKIIEKFKLKHMRIKGRMIRNKCKMISFICFGISRKAGNVRDI